MDFMMLVTFVGGLVVLVLGAYALVEGGVAVARILGIPAVVVGLTVVAFGTSAPEFFVSLVGALRGSTALVLGNVIGSNVANLGLILAVGGLMRPVIVKRELARREVPLMALATVLFGILVWDGGISRLDAGILSASFLGFMGWTIGRRRDSLPVVQAASLAEKAPLRNRGWRGILSGSLLTVVGIAGLALGGKLITDSAVTIAHSLGVSEAVIGLTMVAVGTSLPELATTIMAALRGEADLALGNIFGSNLFNLLGVAGPVGLIRPLISEREGLPMAWYGLTMTKFHFQVVTLELVTMLVLFLVLTRGGKLTRLRSGLLLVFYFGLMVSWII